MTTTASTAPTNYRNTGYNSQQQTQSTQSQLGTLEAKKLTGIYDGWQDFGISNEAGGLQTQINDLVSSGKLSLSQAQQFNAQDSQIDGEDTGGIADNSTSANSLATMKNSLDSLATQLNAIADGTDSGATDSLTPGDFSGARTPRSPRAPSPTG